MSQQPPFNPTPQPIHNIITDTAKTSATQKLSKVTENNITPLSRRRFIQSVGATAAGSMGLGLVGCKNDSQRVPYQPPYLEQSEFAFEHGIASGDPLADKVILWTRITPKNPVDKVLVHWEIARDEQMQEVVNKGEVSTSARQDYTVKVDADGLQPNTIYYYRFTVAKTKVQSRIGRTKTLPVADVSQVKLAVFSCANYPAGYFHVYADAAHRDDIDVCVHLGDYIYEYGRTSINQNGEKVPAYASAHASELEREVMPETEIVSIQDYRLRHAQYKTDPDLQRLHERIPMIAVWDDHELSNDTFKDGAENHQPDVEGKWDTRKLSAVTAYHEWMPTRNQVPSEIYRRFDFGSLLSLHMLDTRVVGRDKQLDYQSYVTIDSATGAMGLDAAKFTQDIYDQNRHLLGLKQTNWLVSQLQQSQATWQLLGQQILMARMLMPAPVILNIVNPNAGVDLMTYLSMAQKAKANPEQLSATEQAILAQPAIPYNLDAWDGYAAARELVLKAAKSLNKNLVVLSGDTHNAWASNLKTVEGESVGVEFATSSVSSPGFEEYLPDTDPKLLQMVLPQLVADLQYCNTHQRGYMLITVTAEQCQSDWIFVSDILKPTYSSQVEKTLYSKVGKNTISE
ncbi:alkaline phosphatase D family protein [Psychrobacter sp. I-STPA6b]|uniref:alkaline phosphatase D family protein n=1 Tax=Psychrobacter sp. I-STPA6b TaxID=2585718 RepID=UPI001D0C32F7|nr:alkaline phosphatase D family protein [Psychrobacter sp. I-STPA6b]